MKIIKQILMGLIVGITFILSSAQADPWVWNTGTLPDVKEQTYDVGSGVLTDGFMLGARWENGDFAMLTADGTTSIVSYGANAYGSGVNTNLTASQTWDAVTMQSLRLGANNPTLTLSGLNTIESGGISFAANGAIAGGTLQAGNGRDLWLFTNDGNGRTATIRSDITGSGGLDIFWGGGGNGWLYLSGNNTFTGNIALHSTQYEIKIGVNSQTALGDSQTVTSNKKAYFTFGSDTVTGATANNAVFSQNFTLPGDSQFIVGANKVTLSGNITGAGALALQSSAGGELVLSGTVLVGGGNINLGSGGTVSVTNYFQLADGNLGSNGASLNISGTFITLSNARVQNNVVLNLLDGGVLDVRAGVNGIEFNSGTGTINQKGGTLLATGGMTVSFHANGQYHLDGGKIEVATGNGVMMKGDTSGALYLNSGTIRVASNNVRTMTSGSIFVNSGGGNFDIANGSLTVQKALQHDSAPRDGGVTKAGAGTLILSGTNTYTGDTIVSAGGFQLASGASLLFQMDDTFAINRINNSGTVTLNDGTINLDLSAVEALTPTASLEWNLFAGAGTYNIDTLNVNFVGGDWVEEATGNEWKWTLDDHTYYTFIRDTGLLTLTAVPEPSVAMLLGVGAALLAVTALTRRRQG
ncbi:MAG: autotransporter-associated beta strand repeat-containing protein [Verrucomicrobiales bacterium]|jgi:autotransporter-associated beta strand protein|nr:autotransporter-associated beta strand repeat-containing protein [Verrucomicrobiales bacterium]